MSNTGVKFYLDQSVQIDPQPNSVEFIHKIILFER